MLVVAGVLCPVSNSIVTGRCGYKSILVKTTAIFGLARVR